MRHGDVTLVIELCPALSIERRQTMPVLANVLLSARDERLSITGTDLEMEL